MRAILEAKGNEPAAAVQLQAQPQPQPAAGISAAAAGSVTGDVQPNLIADLTEKLGRTPLKRLEQMIDYDEEQAAAILKQWMRGAQRA
jgi:flagellar M-ring protein FliF